MEEILLKISAICFREKKGEEYDYFHFHRRRYLDLFKRLSDLKSIENGKLLDLGSYAGHTLIAGQQIGYDVYGCDLQKYVSEYRDRFLMLGIKNLPCDLRSESIPYNDNFFEIVVMSEILEHFNFHPAAVFREIYRVLKPGGKILITTPNQARLNNRVKAILGKSINYDISEPYNAMAHFREYTADEIEYLLKAVGLKSIKTDFIYIDYPDSGYMIKLVNKICGFLFKKLKSNIIVIGKKSDA